MGMPSGTVNILSMSLPPEPAMREELKRLLEAAQQCVRSDVVIDFSHVDIVTSASFSHLIRLQKLADDAGSRLILCGIQSVTKGVFDVTGLDDVFEMCEHMSEAMARLQAGRSH